MRHYQLTLAGMPVTCTFSYAETADFFGKWCNEVSPAPSSISITEGGWDYWEKYTGLRGPRAEYSLMSAYVSAALLPYGRGLFHAAAFSIRGKAWLITAPPGTGKSTQLKTLHELYPGEISTICGDRPVLELTDDGNVTVHPSPWNGKEGWGGSTSAPLAGIIFLQRGNENKITPLPLKAAVMQIYAALLNSAESVDEVKAAAEFTDELLKRTRVWFLLNKGVPDSTKLLYDQLLSREPML